MSGDHELSGPRPARYPAAEAEPAAGPVLTDVLRDGRRWPLATDAEVAWIAATTTIDKTITSAVPPVYEAYATVLLPADLDDQARHDEAVLSVLRAHSSPGGRWWLGYLDTGADDVVFPEAPRVRLYSGWPYVLVQAGPEQAASWRGWDRGASFWSGRLPTLMFPTDRSWLVSTLWDDDWTCVGGPGALVDDLVRHPELKRRCRTVELGLDATPPGHQAI
ncbi:MAG: hypothetical protein ACR2N4_05655 [Jatrophihabitans sp.]